MGHGVRMRVLMSVMCALRGGGGLEVASTLKGESGTAVQPVQQPALEDVCDERPAHEDVRDEGLENTVREQGVQVDGKYVFLNIVFVF
ncbi:hypothetical protein ACOSQ4_017407 [Xanthoceras sorbifolium]